VVSRDSRGVIVGWIHNHVLRWSYEVCDGSVVPSGKSLTDSLQNSDVLESWVWR
jgi:hypothetical protein